MKKVLFFCLVLFVVLQAISQQKDAPAGEKNRAWIPADPAVGVIGLESWLKSRVWFGKRWAIDTSITNDMIVPFAIFVTDSVHRVTEDRTSYYLVTSFDRLYQGMLSACPSWARWKAGLAGISDQC